MRSTTPKQYLTLGEKSVLELTIEHLLAEPRINSVTTCIAAGDTHWSTLPIREHSRVRVTQGGLSRAHSVLNGLSSISDVARNDDWVIVHDAARPCLSSKTLTQFIDTLADHPVGGLLAVPARDTLKQVRVEGALTYVESTVDRANIWQAQTPQMFRFGLLQTALAKALKEGAAITDEASAIEWAGHDVVVVEGEQTNLKITTRDDLIIAEAILKNVD